MNQISPVLKASDTEEEVKLNDIRSHPDSGVVTDPVLWLATPDASTPPP
jgi:hypothetical protein